MSARRAEPSDAMEDGAVLATLIIREVVVNGTPSVAADVNATGITQDRLRVCLQLLVDGMTR
jgi:hypothetical protein